MLPAAETRDASAVANFVRTIHRQLFPGGDLGFFDRLFCDVSDMYAGRAGGFLPVDLRYHDFEHVLQATTCMAELLIGRERAGADPPLTPRDFNLGLASILLHDVGYLKVGTDIAGTGAKYTYTHVLRSCAVAASYLPQLGVTLAELDGVLAAIRCTGPTANINQLVFRHPLEKTIGSCVATADYLAQMAADDYPEKLGLLFRELEESDDYLHVPAEQRVFGSVEELIRKTPAFWHKLVEPKLRRDFEGVFRYLSEPYPEGPNSYLLAVERNIALIREMASASAGRSS